MKLLTLVLTCLLFSCNDNNQICCYALSAGATFYIVNVQGEGLLNPSHPSTVDLSKIRVYYLINGEEVLARRRGFWISAPEHLGFDKV